MLPGLHRLAETGASQRDAEKKETAQQPLFVARLIPAQGGTPAAFEDKGMVVKVTFGKAATMAGGKNDTAKHTTLLNLTAVLNVRYKDTGKVESTTTELTKTMRWTSSGPQPVWSTKGDGGKALYLFTFGSYLAAKAEAKRRSDPSLARDVFLAGLQAPSYLDIHYAAFGKKKTGLLGRLGGSTGCGSYEWYDEMMESIREEEPSDDDETGGAAECDVADEIELTRDL